MGAGEFWFQIDKRLARNALTRAVVQDASERMVISCLS